MRITHLFLSNFRNYKNQTIEFDSDINSLCGKNAQGKTNLIEAIFFACIGKSFRTNKEKQLIRWGEEFSKIILFANNEVRTKKIEVIIFNNQKKIVKLDGIPIKRIGDVLGEVPIVFFSPDELKLVKESPDERRKFMNIHISQTNKKYFYLLSRYEKILDNRNKLLKTTKDFNVLKENIQIWDKALASTGIKIIKERENFIKDIQPFASKAHEYISGGEKLSLIYKTCEVDDEQQFLKKLSKSLEKDFKLGYTTCGPHRDDIDIYVNEEEVKSFGSQGQQRTVALSLKLAELEIMKNVTDEYPILIFYDVFSELDETRRKKLIKFTSRCQTFITTTDENLCEGKIVRVEDGKAN